MATQALVLLIDFAEPAALAACRHALHQFATALCLHQQQGVGQPTADAGPAAPPLSQRPVLGLCNLAKPPQAPKPVLQVRCRPAPFALRDFHAAVARLVHAGNGGGGDAIAGTTAAAALQQLVGVVAQDAACAAAGRRSVLYLTDRLGFEPEDFGGCLEVCRSKGVHVELVFATWPGGGGGNDDPAVEALAAAWTAAEAAFPCLSVTVVRGASSASFAELGGALLQRCVPQPGLAVSLQFKQPLVGAVRSLPLLATAEVRPLAQAVGHALLCPCHHAPASVGAPRATLACAVSGTPLDRRQCHRDECTVVVGGSPGGALHLAAPFDIASVATGAGGGGAATLSVLSRVKLSDANPALLFGLPLLLSAQQPGQKAFKLVADGEVADVATDALLDLLCTSLWSAGEALLASSTTDLHHGTPGLFRLHYLLLPCEAGGGRPATLCAKRVASAEEAAEPLLPAGGPGAEAALPPAVVEAVAGQLGRVPLEPLDPRRLSSRCGETVEMLVRESQPMPKAPTAPAVQAAAAVASHPQSGSQVADQALPLGRAQAGGKGKKPAVATQVVGGSTRESGGRKQAAAAGGGGGKSTLTLKRTARR